MKKYIKITTDDGEVIIDKTKKCKIDYVWQGDGAEMVNEYYGSLLTRITTEGIGLSLRFESDCHKEELRRTE